MCNFCDYKKTFNNYTIFYKPVKKISLLYVYFFTLYLLLLPHYYSLI